ncbi:MAG: hypothetical protein WDA08_10640 [Weeksellaceae bacterium]
MRYLFILLFFSVNSVLSAQDYRIGSFYEGYIIKKDGSRDRGYILYTDESKRFEQVTFRKEKKGKNQRLKPKDIAGYKIADQVYHSVNYKDFPFSNTRFLLLEKDGCLKEYSYKFYNEGAWVRHTILKNDEGEAENMDTYLLNFSKKMSNMVRKDEALAQKILNKEKGYDLLHYNEIIDAYNANCETESDD